MLTTMQEIRDVVAHVKRLGVEVVKLESRSIYDCDIHLADGQVIVVSAVSSNLIAYIFKTLYPRETESQFAAAARERMKRMRDKDNDKVSRIYNLKKRK